MTVWRGGIQAIAARAYGLERGVERVAEERRALTCHPLRVATVEGVLGVRARAQAHDARATLLRRASWVIQETLATPWSRALAVCPMDGVAGLQRLFGLSVPPFCLSSIVYAGLGDHAFGLARLVGKRAPPRLVRLARRGYLATTSVLATTAAIALASQCGSLRGDACETGAHPLAERSCMACAALTLMLLVALAVVDRVATPLFSLSDIDACATTLTARYTRALTAAVAWWALGEGADHAVLLLLLVATRRALAKAEIMSGFAGLIFKSYAVMSCVSVLSGSCSGEPRHAVALTTAVLVS